MCERWAYERCGQRASELRPWSLARRARVLSARRRPASKSEQTIKLLKDNQVIEYDAKPTKSTMEQFLNTVL
jgi:hypothetical protein